MTRACLLFAPAALPSSRLRCRRLPTTLYSLEITPARTCTEAAAQARAALRRYREVVRSGGDLADSQTARLQQQQPLQRRLKVRLPLPSPGREDDAIYNYDQADWPGGILQRFRRLRPLIEEHLLAGYEPQFLGMLESPADGIGVWRAAGGDTTVVAQVGNMNFAPFARLCAGEFGAAVKEPGHTLMVVNPTWTQSSDIGQLWDRKLKQQAAAIIDDSSSWLPLYYMWDVRTEKGATGMLFRSWPRDWQLYHATAHQENPVAAFDEPPILVTPEQPSREQQVESLNSAMQEGLRREREAKAAAGKQWWQ